MVTVQMPNRFECASDQGMSRIRARIVVRIFALVTIIARHGQLVVYGCAHDANTMRPDCEKYAAVTIRLVV